MTGDRDRAPSPRRGLQVLLVLLAVTAPAAAFHEQGVPNCDGCHVTHDWTMLPIGPDDPALLLAETPSDVCLRCHASGSISVLGSDPLSPSPQRGAGDFVFLLEDNLNDAASGMSDPIPGAAAGHSIFAPGHGLAADPRYSFAPGGTFPSDQLGCTSCHDPHGRAEFRLLWGVGAIQGGSYQFGSAAPRATGLPLAANAVESPASHTAYQGGMSDWCGNCHGRYHDSGGSGFEHPGGEILEPEIANQYNVYDGDANPIGGSFATAYLPEVPFEGGGATTTSTDGPVATSRVMCLSCHRAHASSAPAAGRWDFNVGLLDEDGLVSGSYRIPNPYLDPDQGTLCSKCHQGGAPD